jgi:WD40 repeat protein
MPEATDVAIGIGITEYRDPELASLSAGLGEVTEVLDAMTAVGFAAPVRPLTGYVTRHAVQEYLRSLPRNIQRLFIYWTGHGSSGSGGDWLFTSDTLSRAPTESDALDPEAVVGLLGSCSDIAQIVMVLDCCGAGATALHIARAIATTSPPEPPPGRRASAISFITATYGEEEAGQRVFAQAVSDALRIGPPSAAWAAQKPMLSPQEVAAAADDWLSTNHAGLRQRALHVGLEAGSAFFRNPNYAPRSSDVLVDDVVLVRRHGILDRILGWVTTTDSGLYLLTGSMGTGKTFIVLQLKADAPVPETSQLARGWIFLDLVGMNLQQCTDTLAPRFGLNASPGSAVLPEDVVKACADARRPVTLVVDAPDEAELRHRVPIVQRLLVPLAATPGVHVVVADRGGARPTATDELAELRRAASETFDLDKDPDAVTDIARHVSRVLLSTPLSPYARQTDLTGAVADQLARRSNGIFLTADMIAQSLAREPEVVPADGQVLGTMVRDGMAAALERRFAAFGPRASQLLDILMPLAWAAGAGVPLEVIWPLMANAIRPADSPVPPIREQDITDALVDVGSFVLRTMDNGRELYRIRHEAVAEYLRSRSPSTGPAAHRRITGALRPGPHGWPSADPYVLTYIAHHAEQGGMLAKLFDDPDSMIYCDPAETLAAATRMNVGDRTDSVDLYLRSGPLLADARPEMRVFVLESMACEGLTRGGLPRSLSFSVQAPCFVRWTTAGKPSPHRLIRSRPDTVEAVAGVRTLNGYRVAAAVGYSYQADPASMAIETWDPQLAVPMQPLEISGSGASAERFAVASWGDEDLLIVAYRNDMLEGRSLTRDKVLWRRDSGRVYEISVVPARGESLIATANSADPVVLSRVATGEVVRTLPPVSGAASFAVGFQIDGNNVICAGTNTGYLDFYATDSGGHLGTVQPEEHWTCAAALVAQGAPLLVGARGDGRIEVRDARNGALRQVSLQDTAEGVETMIVLNGGSGQPIIATADSSLITLWSCEARRLAILRGHAGDVSALDTVPSRYGHEEIVSASTDGTVRVWEGGGRGGSSSHDARTAKGSFSRVFPGQVKGRTVVLAQALMSMPLIDGGDGHAIKVRQQPLPVYDDHDREIESYGRGVWAVAPWGGNTIALTSHNGSAQRMWDVDNQAEYAVPTPGISGKRPGQVLLTRPDQPLLVIGGNDERIGVFTFDGRRQCWLDCPGGSSPAIPVHDPRGDLALVHSGGDSYVVHDPVTGAALYRVPVKQLAARSSRLPTAVVAQGTESGAALVHGVPRIGTWLTNPLGREFEVLPGESPRCGTVVTLAGEMLFALGWENKVVLVRPEDGTVLAKIPVVGAVHDISAPEPGSMCLVAANRVIWIDLRDTLTGGA